MGEVNSHYHSQKMFIRCQSSGQPIFLIHARSISHNSSLIQINLNRVNPWASWRIFLLMNPYKEVPLGKAVFLSMQQLPSLAAEGLLNNRRSLNKRGIPLLSKMEITTSKDNSKMTHAFSHNNLTLQWQIKMSSYQRRPQIQCSAS